MFSRHRLSLFPIQQTELIERRCILGIDLQRGLPLDRGSLRLAGSQLKLSELGVRAGVMRIELHCLAQSRKSLRFVLVAIILAGQSGSVKIVCTEIVGIYCTSISE